MSIARRSEATKLHYIFCEDCQIAGLRNLLATRFSHCTPRIFFNT